MSIKSKVSAFMVKRREKHDARMAAKAHKAEEQLERYKKLEGYRSKIHERNEYASKHNSTWGAKVGNFVKQTAASKPRAAPRGKAYDPFAGIRSSSSSGSIFGGSSGGDMLGGIFGSPAPRRASAPRRRRKGHKGHKGHRKKTRRHSRHTQKAAPIRNNQFDMFGRL